MYGEIQTHLMKLSLFNIDGQQEIKFLTAATVWIKASHVRKFTTFNQEADTGLNQALHAEQASWSCLFCLY